MQTKLQSALDAQIISALSIAITHMFEILDTKELTCSDIELVNKVYEEVTNASKLLQCKIDLKVNKN